MSSAIQQGAGRFFPHAGPGPAARWGLRHLLEEGESLLFLWGHVLLLSMIQKGPSRSRWRMLEASRGSGSRGGGEGRQDFAGGGPR